MKLKTRISLLVFLFGKDLAITIINCHINELTPNDFNEYLSPFEKRIIDRWIKLRNELKK